MSPAVERLEALLAQHGESAVLRFSLGDAYLQSDPTLAVEHLRRAVALDPDYSAAWKLLGRALTADGEQVAAVRAYHQGIDTALRRGDIQAAKEMQVFLRRLERG